MRAVTVAAVQRFVALDAAGRMLLETYARCGACDHVLRFSLYTLGEAYDAFRAVGFADTRLDDADEDTLHPPALQLLTQLPDGFAIENLCRSCASPSVYVIERLEENGIERFRPLVVVERATEPPL